MKNYTKAEIEKIIKDEIKSYVKDQLDDEVFKVIKKMGGKTRNEMLEISKHALSKFAEFMFIRRNIWKGDIK